MTQSLRDRRTRSAARAQSALAVFDEPISVARLVLRYAVTGLLALVIVSVVTALVSRELGTQSAIEDAVRITSLTAGAAVEPLLTDGVLTEERPLWWSRSQKVPKTSNDVVPNACPPSVSSPCWTLLICIQHESSTS